VLMLRGPQTPGELKQRTERLHPLADLAAVIGALERLIERDLAVRLQRRPGQKEERYAELLGEDAPQESAAPGPVAPAPAPVHDDGEPVAPAPRASPPAAPPPGPDPRVDRLEQEMAALRADLGALRASLDALREELGA
jgi:uncharacterized protein YceH (UPF0502 family)